MNFICFFMKYDKNDNKIIIVLLSFLSNIYVKLQILVFLFIRKNPKNCLFFRPTFEPFN